MALSVVVTIPVVIFFYIAQRYLISGLSTGAGTGLPRGIVLEVAPAHHGDRLALPGYAAEDAALRRHLHGDGGPAVRDDRTSGNPLHSSAGGPRPAPLCLPEVQPKHPSGQDEPR